MPPKYIKSAEDLVTQSSKTVAGFIEQATHKKTLAADTLEEINVLVNDLDKVNNSEELKKLFAGELHRERLLTAAGLSEKAKRHLNHGEKDEILKHVFGNYLQQDVGSVINEIKVRYILTKGDTVGGSMRNWIGAEAGRKLSNAVITRLRKKGIEPTVQISDRKKITHVEWAKRLLLLDKSIPMLGKKNIDVVLLNTENAAGTFARILKNADTFLACGELKGGIDPAGADEHWKTARSALTRIRDTYQKLKMPCPALFFVGAAIERAMAAEIFGMLRDGDLAFAANLTNDDQLNDLVAWLIEL